LGSDASLPYATGDIGRIDEAGRLWIEGRKSNLLITSHGRNISPEWVEEACWPRQTSCRPWSMAMACPLQALLVPAHPAADLGAGGGTHEQPATRLCPNRRMARGRPFHTDERPPHRQWTPAP
jgi:hypothetical protein